MFFYHLEKAIKSYRQYAQMKLKENEYTITIDQWLVLKSIIDNPDITQNELAEMVFKDKASIARIIELLVNNKYLNRNAHPETRNRHQLSITDKGKKIIKDVMPSVLKNRRTALKGVTERELTSTLKVMKLIISNCKNNSKIYFYENSSFDYYIVFMFSFRSRPNAEPARCFLESGWKA